MTTQQPQPQTEQPQPEQPLADNPLDLALRLGKLEGLIEMVIEQQRAHTAALAETRTETSDRINALRTETNARIDALGERMDARNDALRTEMVQANTELRTEMNRRLDKIESQQTRLFFTAIGAAIAVAVTVLTGQALF